MIEIGKIYKSQEATKLTNLMDNFKLEEHSLPKSKPKSLKNKKINSNSKIDISDLPNDIYFIKIDSDCFKFIKR